MRLGGGGEEWVHPSMTRSPPVSLARDGVLTRGHQLWSSRDGYRRRTENEIGRIVEVLVLSVPIYRPRGPSTTHGTGTCAPEVPGQNLGGGRRPSGWRRSRKAGHGYLHVVFARYGDARPWEIVFRLYERRPVPGGTTDKPPAAGAVPLFSGS